MKTKNAWLVNLDMYNVGKIFLLNIPMQQTKNIIKYRVQKSRPSVMYIQGGREPWQKMPTRHVIA